MSFDIQTLSLSEICTDISYGYTASANSEIVGPKFLRITDIQGGVVDWDTVPYCEIPESKLNKNLLSQGDIVVARTGNSTGENYMFSGDEPSVFTSYLIRFKVDSNIANPHYVWLQMRTRRWWDFVSGAKSGSAQAGANATVLGKFEVNLPPKYVQDYVVEVISCLSSKISLNTSTNQTLEQMAQAIFKSWFVDFDPVKAKMNGEQPEGMDAATASLFPEKLVESELGLIPDGWEVGTLSSIVDVIMGQSPKGTTYNDQGDGTPLVNGPVEFGVYHPVAQKWTTAPTKFSKDKDLIVCVRGSTTGRYVVSDGEYCLGRGVCSIRSDDSPAYANYLFKSQLNSLLILTTGSTFPSWSGPTLKNFKVVVPPKSNIEKFESVVGNLCSLMAQNTSENESLSLLRDSLLPKLLSGEIELEVK
ncbi:EcoKI restriction-modification system protein HsdS [Photobacterium damselae subsp. piscicida]|uniref:EcoKI restriction-modification system protein HsdS n=2 Tax=Photobacterium damselae TaxID=38293 RepID=A0A1V1VG89_PHODP|nr:restriction endonuclease subunit S [Photobacterium damselae]MDP2544347.1 restriction endonuclease subunit S [Photobacterium damselae subsp. piscicida]QOD54496.1 restriction endonuclease subunit S [Photobacterium damselae subsp. piscicida]QOD58711.1 restriction endonuclease subunit S [Photobacterium damselae subsp. piscicida]BAX54701.1 EcoKI restriction-modification system protein HsdS [Photobacterium damselae subsp. piscicida]GAW46911.1 EcoKI restriction-modification system protein HsdS [Ph